MSRPDVVPATARWEPNENLWHDGHGPGDQRVGMQRYWRGDGTVYGFTEYSDTGQRVGVSNWFHPDGTLALMQTWKRTSPPAAPIQDYRRSRSCRGKHCECAPIHRQSKKIWRMVEGRADGHDLYFFEDGARCTARGEPLPATVLPQRKPAKPTKNALVAKWRRFERLLDGKGLGWMLHYAPRALRMSGSKKWASNARAFLPDDYRDFVAEVGYPMLGTTLYCDRAWSFLPPGAIAAYAHLMLDENNDHPERRAYGAFFAAYRDLADMTGYAFVERKGQLSVWSSDGGGVEKRLGSFTAWMTGELARLTKWVNRLSASAQAKLANESEDADDPHRLIDYAR